VRGGQTTNVVKTTNWEAPDTALWNGPFLTMMPGDSFTYSCSYSNTDPFPITAGGSAAHNEMCMAIGDFFPSGWAPGFYARLIVRRKHAKACARQKSPSVPGFS